MLRSESAKTLGDWIFEDILCRWGALSEIVSDNGVPYIKALDYLAKRYHIHHIRISGYNSCANGTVERSHFDVRQALFKAADGDQAHWHQAVYSVFWANRITTRNAWVARRISPRLGLNLFSLLISSKQLIYSRHQRRFYPPPTLSPAAQLPFKSVKSTSPHSIQPSLMHADTPQNNSSAITTQQYVTSISSAAPSFSSAIQP
jgi:hypothetical protein